MPTPSEGRKAITMFLDNVRNFFPALLEADKWLKALEDGEILAKSQAAKLADLEASVTSAETRAASASQSARLAEEKSRLDQSEGLRVSTELSDLKAQVSEYATRAELLADIDRLTVARDSLAEDIANLRSKYF